ncbi:MAG: methyltransferase domain-containing protein [Patescibacteria group bacterium]
MLTLKDINKSHKQQLTNPFIGDEDGLLMTSYQSSAERIGQKIYNELGPANILELCCGIGGITAFLAKQHKHIWAVDFDKSKLGFAKTNLKNQNVDSKVTLLEGDIQDESFLKSFMKYNINAVVTDVHWRSDLTADIYSTTSDLNSTIPPTPPLFKTIQTYITENIVMHLGPHTNFQQLKDLGKCTIEKHVNSEGVVKSLTVYFGKLTSLNEVEVFKL